MNTNTKIFFVVLFTMIILPVQNTSAANKGIIEVVTKPRNATIYVNSKRKGNSPAERGQRFALMLPEGEYIVEAIKSTGDGMHEYYGKKKIFIAEDSFQTIRLKLKKRLDKQAKKKFLQKHPDGYIKPAMIMIMGGTFEMGCVSGNGDCADDETPAHIVKVDNFMMGKYEVTFDEWDACVKMGGCSHIPDDKGWGRGKKPVMNVSWNEVHEYIAWLNRTSGKQYRLPTEAEWEYACRGGRKNEKYCGGNSLDQLAWYNKNKNNGQLLLALQGRKNTPKPHPVGRKQSNGFGLYDMSGNVWEWVEDWYNERYYTKHVGDNPKGPSSGRNRVNRGGSWYNIARKLRSANRNYAAPDRHYNLIGFRLLRMP